MATGGNAVDKFPTEELSEEILAARKMASSHHLLARINDEFLTCQICFETYTSPKSLNCQHTFCKKCLQEYLTPNATAIQCPTCRFDQPLPNGGIHGLKDNFFISSMSDMLKTVKEISNEGGHSTSLLCDTCDEDCKKSAMSRCLDCTDFLCGDCSLWHRRTKLTRGHKIVTLQEFESGIHNKELKTRAKIYCTVHDGEAAKMYCKTCECPICHECVESDHAVHSRCSLKDEVTNQSLQIEKLLVRTQSKVDVLQDMIKSMKDMTQITQRSAENVEELITRSCTAVVTAVMKRKEELIDELHEMRNAEVKQINADADDVELQINSLNSCSEFSRKVLEYGTPKEILGLKSQMAHMVQQLLETHPAHKYHKENRRGQTEFTFHSGDMRQAKAILGKLGKAAKPYPDSIIQVFHHLDTFCVQSNPKPQVEKDVAQSEKQEEICLIKQLGKQGDGDGEFESTPQIALNSIGEVITSDADGCKIQIFDPQGRFKDSFKTEVKGKSLHPSGIAILRNDDIAVCCEDQVYVWTYEGKILQGIGKGCFTNCNSIAVDSKNRLVVSDVAQRVITILGSDGSFVCKFDGSESGCSDKLVEPRYITCDSKDNIIVSDAGNCNVKKFSPMGELVCTFGEEGCRDGQFQGPRGICTDRNDNIIVADCWSHRVDMFSPDGIFIKHLISDYDGLHFPWSLAMTSSRQLMLSEDYSWTVKIFSLPDLEPFTYHAPPEADATSAVTLIRGLELMQGRFDMSKILNHKLSRWLKSSTSEVPGDHIWKSLKISNGDEFAVKDKAMKPATRSKSFTSDSTITRERFASDQGSFSTSTLGPVSSFQQQKGKRNLSSHE